MRSHTADPLAIDLLKPTRAHLVVHILVLCMNGTHVTTCAPPSLPCTAAASRSGKPQLNGSNTHNPTDVLGTPVDASGADATTNTARALTTRRRGHEFFPLGLGNFPVNIAVPGRVFLRVHRAQSILLSPVPALRTFATTPRARLAST